MLSIKGLQVTSGDMPVLQDASLDVQQGEVVAVVGANGAGKSTLLNTISGLLPVRKGEIYFGGVEISHMSAYRRARMGIAHVPEGRQLFPSLSVRDNLCLGAYGRKDKSRKAVERDLEGVFSLFPRLKEREKQAAHSLSGGEQQMAAIGRALMAKPALLLMDEPSIGLAPLVLKEILRIVEELGRSGITILLVEQNMRAALRVSQHAYVIENGRIVLQGNSSDLAKDERVRRAYMGAGPSTSIDTGAPC